MNTPQFCAVKKSGMKLYFEVYFFQFVLLRINLYLRGIKSWNYLCVKPSHFNDQQQSQDGRYCLQHGFVFLSVYKVLTQNLLKHSYRKRNNYRSLSSMKKR